MKPATLVSTGAFASGLNRMRSIAMPSRSHHTDSFERLNKALGLAKGTPLSDRMASGRPRARDAAACRKDQPCVAEVRSSDTPGPMVELTAIFLR